MPHVPEPPGLRLLRHPDGRDARGRELSTPANLPRFAPPRPRGLDADARYAWDQIAEFGQRARLLHQWSTMAMRQAALAWSRFCKIQRRWARGEATDRAVADASRDVRVWLHEFGMTPAREGLLASAAAQHPVEAEEDPFEWRGPARG